MRQTVPAAIVTILLTTTSLFAARQTGPQPKDLTAQFASAGLSIERLQVLEVGGVVLIRGRAYDRDSAEEAGRVAQSLGHNRVANLVQVVTPPDDEAIERLAERELTIHRSLDGCKFSVDSERGVLHVHGEVRSELQKDMAVAVLRSIDGVRAVDANLQRR